MPRRPRSLAGTHLFVKGGIYYWRRTDPLTGKRPPRSTGTHNLETALRVATEFEEEWERRNAGLPTLDGWKGDLVKLSADWLRHEEQEGASALVLGRKRFRITRALAELDLRTPADLADVSKLHEKVMRLEGKRVGRVVATKAHLREAWQEPLKQLSAWLAENGRCLDRDPLASWSPIPRKGGGKRARRALLPDEAARAMQAADWLDAIHGRKHSTRQTWTLLLVSAARAGALVSRDREHFVKGEARLELGADVGNKRRGAAHLDPETAKELAAHLEARDPWETDVPEGEEPGPEPLLLSPAGVRWGLERLLDCWREALGLGFVWELWPEGEPWSPETGHQVNQALMRGRPSVSKGGRPTTKPSDEAKARKKNEQARERYLLVLAAQLRGEWEEKMRGLDVHALRMAHRTWALACGVPEVLIDRQLGHAARAGGEEMVLLRVVQGSRVGRQRYTDMRSAMLDASRSAVAVRQLLDEALARLAGTKQPTAEEPEVASG